jgi:large subunit ribosomal protein L13
MKTFMARSEDIHKKWYLIDANGKTVGRIATRIATILRGKGKPEFTPHADIGKKWSQKKYYWHTPYPGGLKSITAGKLLEEKPEEILQKAVWGMLPKTKWQKKLITRLKIYSGDEHPHKAQNPERLEV